MASNVESTPDPVSLAVSTADEVAAALKRAADAGQSIVIRGAGTKMDWGRTPAHIDCVLDMRGLHRLLAHEHGDLTATIEAGAALRDVNAALARKGQWLPLDPPNADRATIGGLLATNDSGPLRHRFGTPRDLVIGMRLATTDGALSKAGGQVVKNVAGYDLGKLVTGSFGSLAAIVSATFKLSPLPASSKTIVVEALDVQALEAIVRAVMSSQLEPIAFDLDVRVPASAAPRHPGAGDITASAFKALLRFASLPAVVDAQIGQLSAVIGIPDRPSSPPPETTSLLDGDGERRLWDAHTTGFWSGPGAIVRASWLPSEIAAVIAAVDVAATQAGCAAPALIGRAAVGSGLVRLDGDDHAQARAIDGLRRSRHLANVVIVRGSPALKSRVDVWGSMGDRQPLLDSLKRALDPRGVLNAGRGPL